METGIKQIRTRLSKDYEETFFQMLQSFQKHLQALNKSYSESAYSFLYPSFGDLFFDERKILIYGQCINGKWEPTFNVNDILENKFVKQGWEFSNTCNPGEASPMDWVSKHWSDYAGYRSFFWNVAYKVTNKLMGIEDYKNSEDWSKYLVWSNLMKIGNVSGGNPNQDEYEAQITFSVKLFLKELEEIKPQIAVLLSGESFSKDFTSSLGLKPNVQDTEFVRIASKVNDIKVILTRRPRVGNNERCVAEIIDYINKL